MATLNVLFQFTSDAQGFTDVPQSAGASWAYDAAGGNPDGRLVGTGDTDVATGEIRRVVSFADLGVPANSTITGISAGKFDWRLNQEPTSSATQSVGRLLITVPNVSTVPFVERQDATNPTNWITATGSGQFTGLSEPTTTQITINLEYALNGFPGEPLPIVSVDNIGFTITYTPPAVVTGSMAAVESGADAFAGNGDVEISGGMSGSEAGADTFAANGWAGDRTGSLAAVESGPDVFAGAGDVGIAGALSVSEAGADSFTGVGTTAQFLDVTFPFNADADGFVDDIASGRWSWASNFGNPGGGLQGSALGGTSLQGNLARAGTYESYGVPAGANITGFELGKFDAIANAYPGPTQQLRIGPLQIGGQTLVPEHIFTGTTGWLTFSQSGSITGLSIPSSTEADLKVGYWIARGTGFGGQPTESLDNVSLRVFYAMPGPIIGSLATVESGADGFAGDGEVVVAGGMVAVESGADGFAGDGEVIVAGALSVSEAGADVFGGDADVKVAGALSVSEAGADVFAGAGVASIEGSMFTMEAGADTFAADGVLLMPGSMAAFETGPDVFAGVGAVRITGAMSVSEVGADVFVGDAHLQGPITAILQAVESGADVLVGGLSSSISGSMAAVESGGDTMTGRLAFEIIDTSFSLGAGIGGIKPWLYE